MVSCKELLIFSALFVFVSVHCENPDVKFRYVTSYNKEGRLLTKNDIDRTTINPLKQTIFIINGIDDGSFYERLTNKYFDKDNYNIFVVEWNLSDEAGHKKVDEIVGTEIGDFIVTLLEKSEEKYVEFHLLGISRGAHVSGLAGRRVSKLSGRNINRITALEPLYDSLNNNKDEISLTSDDANFVDSVHADVEKFKRELKNKIGHVDFYVNAPGDCKSISKDRCTLAAIEYFIESINTDKFKAVECASLDDFTAGKCDNHDSVVFGENVDKTARGSFFLNANDKFHLL